MDVSAWHSEHCAGEVLSAMADGELGAEEASAASAHLSGCPWCRDELVALEGVRAALRRAMVPLLPDSFEDDLIRRVEGLSESPAPSAPMTNESMGSDPPTTVPERGHGAADRSDGPEVCDVPAVVAIRRRAAVTAAAVVAVAAALTLSVLGHEPTVTPNVGRMVESHLTSTGGADPSRLAPAAVPAAFGGR